MCGGNCEHCIHLEVRERLIAVGPVSPLRGALGIEPRFSSAYSAEPSHWLQPKQYFKTNICRHSKLTSCQDMLVNFLGGQPAHCGLRHGRMDSVIKKETNWSYPQSYHNHLMALSNGWMTFRTMTNLFSGARVFFFLFSFFY